VICKAEIFTLPRIGNIHVALTDKFMFLTSANDRRYIICAVERRDFNVLSADSSRREKRKVLSLKIYFTKMLFREVLLYHFMPIALKV